MHEQDAGRRAQNRRPFHLLAFLILGDASQLHRRRRGDERNRDGAAPAVQARARQCRRRVRPRDGLALKRNGLRCGCVYSTSRRTRAWSRSASRSMSDAAAARGAGGRATARPCRCRRVRGRRRRQPSRQHRGARHDGVRLPGHSKSALILTFRLFRRTSTVSRSAAACYDSPCRPSRSEILSNVRHSRCTPSPSSPPAITRRASRQSRSLISPAAR